MPSRRKSQSEDLSLSHCRGLLWVAQGNAEKGGIQFGGEKEEQGWGVSRVVPAQALTAELGHSRQPLAPLFLLLAASSKHSAVGTF